MPRPKWFKAAFDFKIPPDCPLPAGRASVWPATSSEVESMASPAPPSLSALYEDYLASLDPIEARASRGALEDWNRFLDGRSPGEVDGKRREWFELSQEEKGLGPAEVKDRSARVERFYGWLAAARPEALREGSKPQPKRAPSRDPSLPAPPPNFSGAGDPKLWMQGPSVGPPPTARSARLGPHGGPIEAARREAAGLSRPRRRAAAPPVALALLALLGGALPYALVFSPRSALEADVRTYLSSADEKAMSKLYAWLLPKAQDYGLAVDPSGVRAEWLETFGSRNSSSGLHEIRLHFSARQRLWGAELPVDFSVSALSRFEPPPSVPLESPPPEEGPQAPPGPNAAPEAEPWDAAAPSQIPLEQAAELSALIGAVRIAMSNYRTAVPSAPVEAGQALAGDMEVLLDRCAKIPAGSRARPVLQEVLQSLLALSREKPGPARMENEFFKLGVKLREAERTIPLAEKP